MRWILIDVVLALLALGVLAVMVVGLWRKVTALSRQVSRAGELVGRATEDLARAQDAAPSGAARPNDLHTAYAPAHASEPLRPVDVPRTPGRSRNDAR